MQNPALLIPPWNCRYTVVLQCCDPTVPVLVTHHIKLAKARKIFESLRDSEIAEGVAGGSEFSLELWQHGSKPTAETMQDDEGTLYNVTYPESTQLDRFSYMDLLQMAGGA